MYTEDQKKEMVDRVDDLRAQGLSIDKAVKEVGTTSASYSIWKKQLSGVQVKVYSGAPKRKKYPKRKAVEAPEPVVHNVRGMDGKVFFFVCTPEQLKAVINGVN